MNPPKSAPRVLVTAKLPDDALRRMRDLVGGGGEVGNPPRDDPAFTDALARAQVVFGSLSEQELARAPRLRWLQLQSAGAAGHARRLPAGVELTCARGVYSVPMAEHVLGMMLALTRGLTEDLRAAPRQQWKHSATRSELHGATCLILGLGGIGREVAWRASAMGMRIVAVKRRVSPGQTAEHTDELADADGLDRLLPLADHLVVTLPGTPQTHHILDARRIGLLRAGAYVYNVGRGSTLDEAALAQALGSGRLAGAGLDVFETEPLPPGSPLWRLPNVILSPHASGSSPRTGERLGELFVAQLQRYLAGQPLENVVDRGLGY